MIFDTLEQRIQTGLQLHRFEQHAIDVVQARHRTHLVLEDRDGAVELLRRGARRIARSVERDPRVAAHGQFAQRFPEILEHRLPASAQQHADR